MAHQSWLSIESQIAKENQKKKKFYVKDKDKTGTGNKSKKIEKKVKL